MTSVDFMNIVIEAQNNVGEAINVKHPDFATMIYVVANQDGTISVCDNGEEVVCKNSATAERIISENVQEYEERIGGYDAALPEEN
jgi:DNA gyrase/topoisomerase IV subunit B